VAKRIRYKAHDKRENVMESVQTFISSTTGARYKVRLDLNEMIYEIKNLSSEKVYRGGEKVKNLNVLKRNAKKRLEGLGVDLGVERRDRTFGLCKKGYTQEKHLEENDERFRKVIGC
jgi:hypothetical protein